MAKAKKKAKTTNMKGNRVQTMVYLDPPVVDRLREIKDASRIPMQTLLREGVADLVKKIETAPEYEWVRERLPGGRGNVHKLKKAKAKS